MQARRLRYVLGIALLGQRKWDCVQLMRAGCPRSMPCSDEDGGVTRTPKLRSFLTSLGVGTQTSVVLHHGPHGRTGLIGERKNTPNEFGLAPAVLSVPHRLAWDPR